MEIDVYSTNMSAAAWDYSWVLVGGYSGHQQGIMQDTSRGHQQGTSKGILCYM